MSDTFGLKIGIEGESDVSAETIASWYTEVYEPTYTSAQSSPQSNPQNSPQSNTTKVGGVK